MILKTLTIEGFRSYQKGTITFDPSLTILVGENNVGKSTIATAIERVAAQLSNETTDIFSIEDYPYLNLGPLALLLTIELSAIEIDELIITIIINRMTNFTPDQKVRVREWFLKQGNIVTIDITRPSTDLRCLIIWGSLSILGQLTTTGDKSQLYTQIVANSQDELFNQILADNVQSTPLPTPFHLGSVIARLFSVYFRRIIEFRVGAMASGRTGAVETLSGGEVASVLLNLKNHRDRREQERFRKIQEAFSRLFAHYSIDAVDTAPGSGVADVVFWEEGRDNPIPLSLVSAGVRQILTLLTNLIAREGLIIFVEHPEEHLHPHGMRFLQSLLRDASKQNQIIVVTHNPYFVDPATLHGLRRTWLTRQQGTRIFDLGHMLAEQDERKRQRLMAQMSTVFRNLTNREMVFARAVILVEDDSQKEFLVPVANILGFNIDANSISVISVGGEDAYSPYFALLDALAIPYIALKDKSWGNGDKYPHDRFFSLGMEIEDFLDGHGLHEKRQAVATEVGVRKMDNDGKRRVMAALAPQLTQQEIPPIFRTILQRAQDFASGEPAVRE